MDFNSFCRACRAFSSPLGQRWQKSQSTPREQPLWCQNHAQGLQVSGCLGFQVREFTNAWRDHIWVFVWRGDESISIHLPRCCIEPLEGAWSCIDATSTYLGDSVSWCETLYAHRTCIIMYHTFSSFSHAFFNALNSNPRNSSKRTWWRRPNDSSFPELPAFPSVVRIYGRTSLTDKNGPSIANCFCRFWQSVPTCYDIQFQCSSCRQEKKTSLVTWSFSCNKNLYYIPIILVTGWLKEGSYNGLVFYNGIVTIYNNLLYTSRENRLIFASSCHKPTALRGAKPHARLTAFITGWRQASGSSTFRTSGVTHWSTKSQLWNEGWTKRWWWPSILMYLKLKIK